jgi:signal transduction histidine kinase
MLDELTRWLFDPSGLTPHGFCLLWQPGMIWLFALSDIAVAIAYFTIPFVLIAFVRRRSDLVFRPMFFLFAAFILLCGTGHWLHLLTLWVPAYGLEGLVNAATAIVSVMTAVALWRLLPQALALPSPMQMREARAALAERDRQARELAEMNADLQQFAYVASHDLKAPLRAISLLVDWVEEDVRASAGTETLNNLDVMRRRIGRLQMLIDSLLTYVRAGHQNAPVDTIDLGELVGEIVTSMPIPEGFVVRMQGAAPVIRTPRPPLEHVLRNLISNAIKHNDLAAGEIVVSARMDGGVAEIRVSDDGPGIATEFHGKIFSIFQTLQRRDEKETSGIGLSIVKKSVERAGGRVWVESAPPARGTTFVFTWHESAA